MNQAPPFRAAAPVGPIRERLGPIVASYGTSKAALTRFAIGAALFFACSAGWVSMMVEAADDPTITAGGFVGYSFLGLLFVGTAVVCVVRLWTSRGMRLDLHASGLSLTRRGRSTEMLWDEIVRWKSSVVRTRVNGVPTGTQHRYTLETADGRRVVLTEVLQRIAELHEKVEGEIVRRRVPAILAGFDAGVPQVFGPVVATPQGLSFKKRELPWTELGSATVANGFITVTGKGRSWARVPYKAVWNAPALLFLCQRQSSARR